MLSHHDAVAHIAVKNIAVARQFYEDTLGLTVSATGGRDRVDYRSGQSTIRVYRSESAGSGQDATLTFAVGDRIDILARALKAKGVRFEHYDLPQTYIEGDVHVAGEQRIAWFSDPDGNLLSMVGG
jgi:catechol 2,3-dioxygenase-like lactoylglutathione lyase family enzyme